MNVVRPSRAAALAVALSAFAVTLTAVPTKPDHHLRSIPANMVSGYFSADTPPVLRVKSGEGTRFVALAANPAT